MTFANYILDSGQNRAAWADRLGVSRGFLSDLLNGKRRPGLDLAARIERETGGAVKAVSWVAETPTPSEDAA